MIVTGLWFFPFGMIPFFNQALSGSFSFTFNFSMGVGLDQCKGTPSLASSSYRERIQSLGFRGSAEVVGTALVTLLVGFLLQFVGTASF